MAFAGVGTTGIGLGNEANAEDVFNAIGPAVFGDDIGGRIFQALLIISVLTSASSSTQTTILPTARDIPLDGRLPGDPRARSPGSTRST